MKPQQVLMWVAEHTNGTVLPQYDPDTGKEHLFKEVDRDNLKSFGLFPFPVELACKTDNRCNPFLPSYVVNLKPEDQIEHFRRVYAKVGAGEGGLNCEKIEYILGIKGKFTWLISENGSVRNLEE